MTFIPQFLRTGQWLSEVPDPYVKAVGINGRRGIIYDARDTDPPGWKNDQRPAIIATTDAIIYELHVRDASISLNSGITQKGKFLGLTEKRFEEHKRLKYRP